ncbi:Hypp1177 [Branchiostoma lanceolatum]|uniref:Hypp1177 protein n=1 Tax=Branchiostoma lanceolatum TaxID=7740 RepID=A0A8J9ZF39_BRALA|nr:Hypp1177 [Branchiostoma lanceolatum]
MPEFFEPSLGGAYPTMSIYGGPLYADFLGPFYRNESGGSFPTTSSTVSSDSVPPPGWEDKTVQDLKDIWKDPEESLLSKYTSTIEREDVPQIEELARLFVFRAKTSPRWLPYYTGLSPTETPCPELQVQATESPGATPTHDDIRVLARDDEMQDVEDWLNAAPDLDISSMLQEAGCDLFSCSDGENMSAATSNGQFTSGQTTEGDRSVLIHCEMPQSSPGWEDKTVKDLQDIWKDPEESLLSKYHSIVEREDVQQIEELARLFVFRAKTSPRWLPYYTGLSPTETPCPELQVQATQSPGATPTHDDIRILARDDEMQDVEDWLNAAPDLDISSMLQEAGCDLFSCSGGENMSAATSTGQSTSDQTPEGDRSVLIGCEERHNLDMSSMLQEAGCDLLSCSDGENMSAATSNGQFTCGQTPEGDRSVLFHCEEPQSSHSVLPPGWEDKTVQDLQDIWKDPEESLFSKYPSKVEREDVPQIEELARLFVFRAKTSRRWLPYYTGLSPTETPCPELQVQAAESPGATPTHDDIRVLARDDEMQDVVDWLNGAPDLDISSMLEEAGCDLLSYSDGENMSVATSTGQFTSGQTSEDDPTVLIGCEESQSSPGCEDKTVQDLQDIWKDPEESLSSKYHSIVEREDVPQIKELARLFVFRAKTSPRWLPYYTGLSPTETPCPELQVQAAESPGATPTHDDIRVLARDDEMQDVEDWLNAAPDLDISSMLQEAGCDLFSCSDGENMSAATSTGQFTSGQTPEDDSSVLIGCEEPHDLDISSMLQEAGCDLLSYSNGENMSAATSNGQFTSNQTPEGDRPVLIGCEEPQSSQCVASFIKEDDSVDLATTTNDSQAELPLPRLLFECQSPVNTTKPSSPATELLLTPVYDDSCAHYPDQPNCAEEPPFLKCTSVQRDDWAMIETVATMFVFHAKYSPRHVPYYTCQSPAGTTPSTPRLAVEGSWVNPYYTCLSPAGTPPSTPRLAAEESWVHPYYTCQSPAGMPLSTPRLAAEESWVHEDVQKLAKRAEEEDIADWVNGMCGTGEDVQGLAKKVDEKDIQDFVNEMCNGQSTPATLMHEDQDVQDLAKKVNKEDTREFVKETCGDQSTPTTLMHQDVQGLSKKDDKEEIHDFVSGDQSTSTTLMHQGKDLQDLSKEADKEDSQDFVNKTCGDRATVTPTTPTHKGEDGHDLAKKVVKENPQDLVQTTPTTLLYQDAQGLEKEEQDNSVVTDMCGASHQMVPTRLTCQDEDIQAKTVEKEDQGNLVTEKDTKAKTNDPKKRGGKWWDLRIKREKMATNKIDDSNIDKKDAKEGRKWWRRIFTRKSGGKTSGNDSGCPWRCACNKAACVALYTFEYLGGGGTHVAEEDGGVFQLRPNEEPRKSRWKIFRRKRSQEKGNGMENEETTKDSKTKWWKRGSKKTGKSQDGTEKRGGWCCM